MRGLNHESSSWRWWISGLLLLATMINYMHRQTWANLPMRITNQFQLTQEQYGDMELVFGVALAIGAVFFGMVADRVSIRWLYPAVLIAWSAMGFTTGLTEGSHSSVQFRKQTFRRFALPCALDSP